MDPAVISIIILGIAIVFYITEWLPIPIVAMGSAALMVLFGVIKASDAWAAFAQDTVLVMAGVVVVGSTLFMTGAADSMANFIIKLAGGKPKLSILLMLAVAGGISAFINNTVCVVMFLPLILGVVAKTRNQGIYEQTYMQMLTIMTSVGGMITLVGSGVNASASGMLTSFELEGFTMLQMTPIAIPMFAVALIYTFFIGDKFANKIFGVNPPSSDFVKEFIENADKKTEEKELSAEEAKEAKSKKTKSAVILILTIAGLLTKDLHGISIGTVAICGALACVITKCITVKQMYSKIEVGTLLMLAGTVGCAAGLSKSGGGQLIADFFLGLVGEMTPLAFFVIISLLAAVITQFMSNTATIGILIPIAVPMAMGLGINPLPVVIGITMCASCSFVTPMASPTQALVINWGSYKFMDFVKYSGPITVILDAIVLILTPMIYPLV